MAKFEYEYPHPAVATDCVVFGFDGKELKVLLIRRGIEPYKDMWAFPGGFLRMDETAEECAIRELEEETGLHVTSIRQLEAFSGVNRDPRERIISIAFYALARQSDVYAGDDASHAQWWAINDVPQLAFDHDYILRRAMQRIKQDIHFEPIGFGLLEEQFTIAELQRLYESILGVNFDRRNFYRKILQTGILQELEPNTDSPEAKTTAPATLQQAEPNTSDIYFGKNKDMKKLSIDDLFKDNSINSMKSYMPAQDMVADPQQQRRMLLCKQADPMPEIDIVATPQPERHTVGRKGKLFRFDKKRYQEIKESGNFRLEF